MKLSYFTYSILYSIYYLIYTMYSFFYLILNIVYFIYLNTCLYIYIHIYFIHTLDNHKEMVLLKWHSTTRWPSGNQVWQLKIHHLQMIVSASNFHFDPGLSQQAMVMTLENNSHLNPRSSPSLLNPHHHPTVIPTFLSIYPSIHLSISK